uniref:Uncharacterized protein n=1 Tax=Aegilops tauschii TaxID=37682 RepID=M8BEJ1_AEGTA
MEFHGLWLPWPASSPVAATPSERHTTTGLLHGDYTNMMETLGLGQPFLVRLAPPTVQVLLPCPPFKYCSHGGSQSQRPLNPTASML